MSRRQKPAGAGARPPRAVRVAAAIAAGLVLALLVVWATRPNRAPHERAPESIGAAGAATASAPPQARSPDPVKAACGRWQRTDGNYTLEITSVRADGRAEAAYFNPTPIHVSRAEVKPDGANAVALIELRDVNYPGCIYRLTYDAAKDELRGDYFQAAIEQTYPVTFVRTDGP